MAHLIESTRKGFVRIEASVPSGRQAARSEGAGVRYLTAASDGVRIVAFSNDTRPAHALLAPASVAVRVNGSLVVGGLRVLQHKDEIRIGSQQLFFSAESVPVAEEYRHEGSGRRPRCPVCRAAVQDGQTVVRCPGCSRLYHQIEATGDSPEKPCWTYSPSCRFCEHPTSMSGETAWRPEQEEFDELDTAKQE